MNIDGRPDTTRSYRMTARAAAADETRVRIMDAAKHAFADSMFDDVTLAVIAEEAGVTVQTVIRRFGSKEFLFESVAAQEMDRVRSDRAIRGDTHGDLASAVRVLVAHYEADGGMMLNLLAQESRSPEVAEVISDGRDLHEEWVQINCAQILTDDDPEMLAAAIAATDLYVWKLLRLDRGMSQKSVGRTMLALLDGLTESEKRK